MIGATSIVSGLIVLALIAWAGSVPSAISQLRGETIVVVDRIVEAEPGKPGESRTVSIDVSNRSSYLIRIVGGTADQ